MQTKMKYTTISFRIASISISFCLFLRALRSASKSGGFIDAASSLLFANSSEIKGRCSQLTEMKHKILLCEQQLCSSCFSVIMNLAYLIYFSYTLSTFISRFMI